MKFQTILAVSDTYDKGYHAFTKGALRKMASENPDKLHYDERDGRGYLMENKVIEISEEDYFSNPKHAWGNHVYVTDISGKSEELKI